MKSIVQFFEENVNKYSNNVYLWEKPGDKYVGTNYSEVRKQVHEFAAGLLQLGLNEGERVSLLSEGCNNWVIGELGILYTGAINVPLSTKLNAEEVRFRLNHSESRFIMVSALQTPKLMEVLDECSTIEKIICFERKEEYGDNEIHFNQVRKLGKAWLSQEANAEIFKEKYKSISPDHFANICYTSGTTADPKGIILTHGNYITNCYQAYSLMDIPPYWKTLLYLPWDHSFAHTAAIFAFMGKGASLASVKQGASPMETLRNFPVNMREIKPNILLSAPAVSKNFKKNIEKGIREKGKFTSFMFDTGIKIAYAYNKEGWNRGTGASKFLGPLVRFFDKLVFSKIRDFFGGELEYFIGGAALLDIELQKFFYAIGVPVFQGYGLSEASPIISSNSKTNHKLGSSGKLVNNMELKICDEEGNSLPAGEKGEIVIKGGNVMYGYWKNKIATEQTIRDGWLHTGDLGYLDEDGYLYVLGRFKSLLISDDGEKYSPESIEEAIMEQSKYIDQCILHNNQQPYTVGLVVANQHNLKAFLDDKNITADSEEGKRAVLMLVEKEINEYRTNGKYAKMFPQRWLPVALGVLDEGFTEDNGLVNATAKVVRGKVINKHADLIDFLYTPAAKAISNERNMEAVERMKLG
ncbi:MAG: AMP-binding protein [Bacteroidales bacterium]